MNRIHVFKFGLACGLTGTLLYLGCVILMLTVGEQGIVLFFNSLLHGLDVAPILRTDVPLWEAGLGIIETFVLSWLIGACIASIYNAMTK